MRAFFGSRSVFARGRIRFASNCAAFAGSRRTWTAFARASATGNCAACSGILLCRREWFDDILIVLDHTRFHGVPLGVGIVDGLDSLEDLWLFAGIGQALY